MHIHKLLTYVVVVTAGLLQINRLSAIDLKTMAQRSALKKEILTNINNKQWEAAANGIQQFKNSNLKRLAIDLREVFVHKYAKPGDLPKGWPSSLKKMVERQQAKAAAINALKAGNFSNALAGIQKLPETTRRDLYEKFVTDAVSAEKVKPVDTPAVTASTTTPTRTAPAHSPVHYELEPKPDSTTVLPTISVPLTTLSPEPKAEPVTIDMGAVVQEQQQKNDALLQAASQQDIEGVKRLLSQGANVDATGEIVLDEDEDKIKGVSSLMIAANEGSKQIVQLLLEANANPNLKDLENEWTAIHIASYKDKPQIIKLLIAHKANIDSEDANKDTPLLVALGNNGISSANLLIDEGANINMTNNHHETPLSIASRGGLDSIVEKLINKGVDVNIKLGKSRKRALISASDKGHERIVELLLNAGAQVNALNSSNNTSLMLASTNGHDKVVNLLLNAGARLSNVDTQGNSALILATQNNHPQIVKLLLDAISKKDKVTGGASPQHKNNKGKTALAIAKERGYQGITTLLENKKEKLQQTSTEQLEQTSKTLLQKLGAQELKSNIYNGITTVEIKVPDQTAAQCGLHVVANLKAIKNQLDPKKHLDTFQNQSKKTFDETFTEASCPLNSREWVKVQFIKNYSDVVGLNNLTVITENTAGSKIHLYESVQIGPAGSDLTTLLHLLKSGKRESINIAISSLLTDKKHYHWSAASILLPKGTQQPIIIFMNSLQHAPKEGITKALEYIIDTFNAVDLSS